MGSINEQAVADDVPVLIVGGGPTGLLAAFLLSKFGGTSCNSQARHWYHLLTIP